MRATKFMMVGLFIAGASSLSQAAEMGLVPVSASGTHTIVGNEIILTSGGQRIVIDLVVSGWSPAEIIAYQTTIESAGYTSGSVGFLAPASVSCTTSADCIPDFGRCSFRGGTCAQNSDCEFANFGELCISGTQCEPASSDLGGPKSCVPVMITSSRPDFALAGASTLPALDVHTPDFRLGAVVLDAPVADPGGQRYGGTLVLDVSPDAAGTFVVNLAPGLPSTLVNPDGSSVTPLTLTPVLVTIGCASNADCDDGNPCTDDICNVSQDCIHPPNFDNKIACCNPTDGTLCDFPPGLPGDTDGDFDVDLADVALFQTCFGMTSIPLACDGTDMDCDCGSGAGDHALLVPAITGPSGP